MSNLRPNLVYISQICKKAVISGVLVAALLHISTKGVELIGAFEMWCVCFIALYVVAGLFDQGE